MNIFVTDSTARECAVMLDDKRLNKMTIETAQILSTAAAIHGASPQYKPTHRQHPCVKWAATSQDNYSWLLGLFKELLAEYTFRFGRVHGCTKVLSELEGLVAVLPAGATSRWPNCSLFKQAPDVHVAYRATMIYKWSRLDKNPRWTNRQQPPWYNDYASLIKPEATDARQDSE